MTFEGSWKQRNEQKGRKKKQILAEEANKPALALLFPCFLAINALTAGLKVEIPVKVPTILLTKTFKNPLQSRFKPLLTPRVRLSKGFFATLVGSDLEGIAHLDYQWNARFRKSRSETWSELNPFWDVLPFNVPELRISNTRGPLLVLGGRIPYGKSTVFSLC